MTFLLALFNQFKSYLVIVGGAIVALLAFKQKVKYDTRKKMQREIDIYNEAVEKAALKERVKRDEEIANISDDERINKLRKYRAKDK